MKELFGRERLKRGDYVIALDYSKYGGSKKDYTLLLIYKDCRLTKEKQLKNSVKYISTSWNSNKSVVKKCRYNSYIASFHPASSNKLYKINRNDRILKEIIIEIL
jgi:hypothetical protein